MDLPQEDDIRWIVSRYAHLRAAHGDAIGVPELVEPTGEYFPDAFVPSAEGVAIFLRRLLTYAPVADDIALEIAFAEMEGDAAGGCGTGACGTGGANGGPVAEAGRHAGADGIENDAAYRLVLPVRDVGEPAVLAASLARCAGGLILGEAGEEVLESERLAMAEIAATLSGFGLLLLCGACVYTKSCGGLRAHQGTALDVTSSALALALFLRVHDVKPAIARRHLETTQREAFDEALRWVDSNGHIVDALRDHPESLVDGVFAIGPVKGFLGRVFGARSPAARVANAPVPKRRVRSEEEEKRLAEDRALVEEALRMD